VIKFVVDEDFDNRVVRGLLRRLSDLDIIRIQDTPLSGVEDSAILEWAAQQRQVLLTHDVSTMTRYAYARIRAGQTTAGII
jgi:predicted nuclease of predicted toxin-antitoxin system